MSREASSSLHVLDGARTPFVRAGGAFAGLDGADLALVAIARLLQGREEFRRQLESVELGLDRVPIGALDPARRLLLRAGLEKDCPGRTTAVGADAGLAVVARLEERRDSGGSGIFLVGGFASASRALGLAKDASPRGGRIEARRGGLLDEHEGKSLARQAEALAVELALTRRDLDAEAFMSRRRARLATSRRRGELAGVVTADELVRDDRTSGENEDLDWLGRLAPLFPATGRLTAGHAAVPADGATMLLLVRERALPADARPLARVAAVAARTSPANRPVPAMLLAMTTILERQGLDLDAIDLIEVHETFAVDVPAFRAISASERLWRRFGLEGAPTGPVAADRLNVAGGAVALGHAGGAGGARMLLALARELEARSARRGLALMAQGGGQATALLLERD